MQSGLSLPLSELSTILKRGTKERPSMLEMSSSYTAFPLYLNTVKSLPVARPGGSPLLDAYNFM